MIFYKLQKKKKNNRSLQIKVSLFKWCILSVRLIEIPLFLKDKTESQAKNELHPFYKYFFHNFTISYRCSGRAHAADFARNIFNSRGTCLE